MHEWSENTHPQCHYMGNGEMLVFALGPNLMAVNGPPYSSLPFISMAITNAAGLCCESNRKEGVWRHRLYRNGACFMELNDHMDRRHNVFVRRFTASASLVFSLIVPPHIRMIYLESYPLAGGNYNCAVFCLSDRVNRPVDPVLFFVPEGDAQIVGGNRLVLRPGAGSVIMLAESPFNNMIRVKNILKNGCGQGLERNRAYYSAVSKRVGRQLKQIQIKEDSGDVRRARELLESAADFLCTMQGRDGGVMKSTSERYAEMSEQYYFIRAFLALGLRKNAAAIMGFISKKLSLFGNLNDRESVGSDDWRDGTPDSGAVLTSYALLSAAAWLRRTGETGYIKSLGPLLSRAAELLLETARGGLIMSDGSEAAITEGYVSHARSYEASARNTLLYIEGLRAVLYICRNIGGEVDHDIIVQRIEESEAAYNACFMRGGFRSYAQPEGPLRRERYRMGVCDGCADRYYPRIGFMLEKTAGGYLCLSCSQRDIGITPQDVSGSEAVSADILLPSYLGSDIIKRETVADFRQKSALPSGFLPVTARGTRCRYGDAGMLVYHLAQKGEDAQLFTSLVNAAGTNGLWAEHAGSPKHTAYTNALCAEAVIRWLQNI